MKKNSLCILLILLLAALLLAACGQQAANDPVEISSSSDYTSWTI